MLQIARIGFIDNPGISLTHGASPSDEFFLS